MFIRRTNTETPVLWPTDEKSSSLEMTLVAGKDWRQEEKGMTEDEMDGSINSMNMSLRKVHEMLKDKEAWHAAVHGFTEPDTTG